MVNFTGIRLRALANTTNELTLRSDQGIIPDTQILVKVRQCRLGEILIDKGQRCPVCVLGCTA